MGHQAHKLDTARWLGGCRRVVLLVGTPNSGKSTVFNIFFGGHSRIGNWPGVTADIHYHAYGDACIVDTPGTYSIEGETLEEEVIVRSIAELRPEKIIFVLDGTQPEAGLYLLVQVLEAYPGPLEVLVSKSLLSHGAGIHIDAEALSHRLGVPFYRVSILEGVGEDTVKALIDARPARRGAFRIDYGPLEPYVKLLEDMVRRLAGGLGLSPRWIAVQLLQGDMIVQDLVRRSGGENAVREAERIRTMLVGQGVDVEDLIASSRLNAAEDLARRYVVRRRPGELAWRIDSILLHPILGPVASALLLFTSFLAVFSVTLGFPLNVILDAVGLETAARVLEEYSLVSLVSRVFEAITSSLPSSGLAWQLVAGVVNGVGVVASFIPLIAVATAFLAVLEDSGIMTRIAVALHPFIERMGVSGRSVYPYLLGLGCNVPAIMSSRLLPRHERIRVVLSIPFVICSARLVVLLAFTFAFFRSPLTQALAAVSLYLLSALVALATARIAHVFTGERYVRPHLVMELPLLHKPSMRVVWWSVRSSLSHFIVKMAGPITVAAVLIWGATYIEVDGSSLGLAVGRIVGTIFEPIGIDPGRAEVLGLAALAGSLVKEVIVESIGIAYGTPDPVKAVSMLSLTPVQAYSLLVFFMLYMPCIATMIALKSEAGGWRVLAGLVAYSLTTATLLMYASYLVLGVILG